MLGLIGSLKGAVAIYCLVVVPADVEVYSPSVGSLSGFGDCASVGSLAGPDVLREETRSVRCYGVRSALVLCLAACSGEDSGGRSACYCTNVALIAFMSVVSRFAEVSE